MALMVRQDQVEGRVKDTYMAIQNPEQVDADVDVEENSASSIRARALRHSVTTLEGLRAITGDVHEAIRTKHTAWLTPLIREYIAASPFFVMGTSDANGNGDVTPRGDVTSVIHIIDDRTIVLPDRPGNRRLDSYRNILENPHVGLLFIVPGIEEALRINGRATITTDPELLAQMAIQDKVPQLGVLVDIDEVFIHCARALLRARLWKPETWPNEDDVPTLAAMWNEQKNLPPPDESAGKRKEEYRSALY